MPDDTEKHQRRLNYETTKRRHEVDLEDLKAWKRGPAIIQALATHRRGEEISALCAPLGDPTRHQVALLVRDALFDAFDAGVESLAKKQRELRRGKK